MRQKLPFVSLLTASLAAVAFTSLATPGQQIDKTERATQLSKQVKCIIKVDNVHWMKGQPALIHIRVENSSSDNVEVEVIPSFRLSKQATGPIDQRKDAYAGAEHSTYWSPFDLATGNSMDLTVVPNSGARRWTAGRVTGNSLLLMAGGGKDLKIDPAKLKWARVISSVWPHRDLFAEVPQGKYLLSFIFQVPDAFVVVGKSRVPTTSRIESNQIEVLIEK